MEPRVSDLHISSDQDWKQTVVQFRIEKRDPPYRMKPSIKEKYVTALRSGDYHQGYRYLIRRKNGKTLHCPLGVLADLFIKEHPSDARWGCPLGTTDWGFIFKKQIPTKFNLPIEVFEWAFHPEAVNVMAAFYMPMEQEIDVIIGDVSLSSELNDSEMFSFNELADIIEKNL
jgi:hypothetical protein